MSEHTLTFEADLTPCLICGVVVYDPQTHLLFHGGAPGMDVVQQLQQWASELDPDDIQNEVNERLGGLGGGADTVGGAVQEWLQHTLVDLFGAPPPADSGGPS